ncbi:MAG TPA: DNA-3-methyladenine glycosylase I [Dehalococcoidia bacterium]|nr:DNA-3-methyladenine glycosylase I [Dehalococcoidia bacterium]
MPDKIRCAWVGSRPESDAMVRYHDEEWGTPQHDDRSLFELLTLEGAQAGLSWDTILKRRDGYRRAFHGFEISRVADLGPEDVDRLMGDTGIIRNRAKVTSTIENARGAIALQREFGSLDAYFWRFVDGAPIVNRPRTMNDVPVRTDVSTAMSKDLQKRGFRFVGPTIMYAFMQATGLVNDHVVTCFRYAELMGHSL